MAEKLSENVLVGVVTVSGGITAQVLGSKAGQKFFRMLPGDVLLASLDAFNKVLDAAEIVGKDALSAASEATVEIVANRFGEEAGEVTHDTFAVAGHAIGTAWNVIKVRKVINPASNGTISASALKALKLKKANKAVTSASKCVETVISPARIYGSAVPQNHQFHIAPPFAQSGICQRAFEYPDQMTRV